MYVATVSPASGEKQVLSTQKNKKPIKHNSINLDRYGVSLLPNHLKYLLPRYPHCCNTKINFIDAKNNSTALRALKDRYTASWSPVNS